MKITITDILNVADSAQPFSGMIDLRWVKRRDQALFPDELAIGGEVANRAGVVTLRYQISGAMVYDCERCMMQAERPFQETFSHIVVRTLEDEELDDAYLIAPQGVLDLADRASADLLLDLPQVLVCRADCKGLCPQCGADLNQTNCGCRRPNVDPRLEKINELL